MKDLYTHSGAIALANGMLEVGDIRVSVSLKRDSVKCIAIKESPNETRYYVSETDAQLLLDARSICIRGYHRVSKKFTKNSPKTCLNFAVMRLRKMSLGAMSTTTATKFHKLRHTHITLQLGDGVDLKTVSMRAGHNKMSTTMGIYSHFITQNDQVAASLTGSLLEKPSA